MDNVAYRKRPSYFLSIAIVGLLAVLIGFSKTFIIPVVHHTFSGPIVVNIHGAFALAWILLFVSQTTLIHFRHYRIHQTMGFLGIFISAGVLITLIPTGMHVAQRDLQAMGESAYSTLLGTITSGLLFFSLVLAGIFKRGNPEAHKRLMLLATIVVLWPAWFRFRHWFPSVPRPDIWFGFVLADSLIIISWIWDKVKNGSVHPVLTWGGAFVILEQSFEVFGFDTPLWRDIAKWTYSLLSNTL